MVSGNDSLHGGPGTDTRVTDATEKSIVEYPQALHCLELQARVATFSPSAALVGDKTHEATITAGVKHQASNAWAQDSGKIYKGSRQGLFTQVPGRYQPVEKVGVELRVTTNRALKAPKTACLVPDLRSKRA